ncbi:MAG TPA: hypothetical protein VM143_00505 [Acidimicrobiales bacterium]|nr:hypothetical protein [Acidimicrobiales bacterium]
MSRAGIEAKLREVSEQLKRVREELAVVEEQLLHFRESADEARVQALVDDSRLSAADAAEAQRHVEAHGRTRDRLAGSIMELERSRDDLLDRLVLESR